MGALCAALLALPLAPAGAEDAAPAGRVTAAVGDTAGLEAHSELPEGAHVRVGAEGGCAVLVDYDAVVELCGETSIVLRRGRKPGTRVVKLDAGEIKLVVDPRALPERVEVHTPAAIATLLGTIVHVSIDPATGSVTIASAQSSVEVRSSDPNVSGRTVVHASQQVTVEPGKPPPHEPVTLRRDQVSALGGCLVDFHAAALGGDRDKHEKAVSERLVALEVGRNREGGSFKPPPPVERPWPSDKLGDKLDGQEDVCVAADCDTPREPIEPLN